MGISKMIPKIVVVVSKSVFAIVAVAGFAVAGSMMKPASPPKTSEAVVSAEACQTIDPDLFVGVSCDETMLDPTSQDLSEAVE